MEEEHLRGVVNKQNNGVATATVVSKKYEYKQRPILVTGNRNRENLSSPFQNC
jgi:hypothetical protein